MPSRLSPTAAREILDDTRSRADQERRAQAQARRRATRAQLAEEAAWAHQANLMIEAAVAGRTLFAFDKPVIRKDQLIAAEFLVTDSVDAALKPTVVQWGKAEPKTPWDDFTLPSWASLSWLAGASGQGFLGWLEVGIKCAARVQQDQISFCVRHSNALRYYITDGPDDQLLCPDMTSMLRVLSVLGWQATATAQADDSFDVSVSW